MATPRSTTQPEKSQTLVSWKEIAAFLGRAERTVKRWERERGLPVHRVPGGERGGVFAYPDELRAWLLGEQNGAAQSTASVEADEFRDKDAPGDLAPGDLVRPAGSGEPEPIASLERIPPASVSESAGFRRVLGWMVASVAMLGVAAAVFFIARHFSRAASSTGRAAGIPTAEPHVPKPGAEELYLQGRYQWSLRTADSLAKSVDAYTQAIGLDPVYAQAYAGLAESYELLPEYAQVNRAEEFARAKVAANRAIELDPNLAAGHRAKGFALFWWDWDVPGSDAEFRHALSLAPNEMETHHWYAMTLLARLQRADAIAQIDNALRLGPTYPAIVADAAFVHAFFHNNRVAALATLRDLEKTQPSLVKSSRYLRRFDYEDGKYTDFLADLRTSAAISHDPYEIALADAAVRGWARGGKAGMLEEERKLELAIFEQGSGSGYALAMTYLELGKPDEALRYLKAALERKDISLMTLSVCACIANLKSDPGYATLLRQIRNYMHLPLEPSGQPASSPRSEKLPTAGSRPH